MAKTPIDNSGMRCTKCKSPQGKCDCWAKVTLRCPDCGLEKKTVRDESDPPNAVVVETHCPKCVGGDFSVVYYYDKDGNEIHSEARP